MFIESTTNQPLNRILGTLNPLLPKLRRISIATNPADAADHPLTSGHSTTSLLRCAAPLSFQAQRKQCSISAEGSCRPIPRLASYQCIFPIELALYFVVDSCINSARSNSSVYVPPCLWSSRTMIHTTSSKEYERNNNQGLNSMSLVRNMLEEEGRFDGGGGSSQDEKLDIVHIKLIKNNTFVTITDSKGNKKAGASLGCLEEMKGGPKASRYAAEATAEHVGRLARTLGLKSVVMRVNGFTHFKKKKQAILAWREGYTHGRGDMSPIAYIEDTTRRPHNGCRLPKKRRI
ncbi:hypothetical protein V2J09_002528 [Rumex salicifolius]